MKVINLFGAAGSGKSTTALGVSHQLKINGYKVEYVSEYAKQLVMSGSEHLLSLQEHVFANQLFNMTILKNKDLDFIVTDSPLLLAVFYGRKYGTSTPALDNLVFEHFDSYQNINYFINRAHKFDPVGRVQTEEETVQDAEDLRTFLSDKIQMKTVESHTLLSSFIAYDVIHNKK